MSVRPVAKCNIEGWGLHRQTWKAVDAVAAIAMAERSWMGAIIWPGDERYPSDLAAKAAIRCSISGVLCGRDHGTRVSRDRQRHRSRPDLGRLFACGPAD